MGWKNIAPLREKLRELPDVDADLVVGDVVELRGDCGLDIASLAKEMKPWRKGPFNLFGTLIDAEWLSFKKYNLLRPHLDLEGKVVADVGCNNGYYLFRMLELSPAKLVGFDPSPIYKTQFDLINHFVKSEIVYELLGVEHLSLYEHKFDTVLCLGVLYHRSDPVGTLKELRGAIVSGGELFLDTFIIGGDDEISLSPATTYSKIPNIYFVPTLRVLKNWLFRAGFKSVEVIDIVKTDSDEQRKTEWIDGESLSEFLDPEDSSKTVEGYEAPTRAYIKARR